jgi:hypothetical protein
MNTRSIASPVFVSSLLLLTTAPACQDSPEDPAGDPGTSESGDLEPGDSGTGEPPPAACPEPTAGPTLHAEDIAGDEVWTADTGPHIVDGTLRIRDGASLTIEPCTVVQLGEDAGFEVAFPGTPSSGTLVAEGEAERPIRFEGLDGARWGRVFVHAPGQVRLAHVTLSGGGAVDGSGATLVAQGDGVLPSDRGLLVDHVTIEGSLGAGVVLSRHAAFAEGSAALVVTGSGSDEHPYPLVIDEHAIGTLPDGDYTGNARDEIFVDPSGPLQEDATMRDLGVAYRVGDSNLDDLVVGAGPDSASLTTLTIDPGVTVRFHPGTSFEIEHNSGAFAASGALVAIGTEAEPIVLTSSAEVPAPGDWIGVWFGGVVDESTRIEHARIEYTGADCGCVLLTCSDVVGTEGAVILTMPPPTAFVSDSVIAHAAANGFVLGYDGALVDFEGANAFEDVEGCAVTLPREGTCPEPLPSCE